MGPLTTTRDYVDARDIGRLLVALAGRATAGEAVNVASGVETPILEIWTTLARLAEARGGPPVRVEWLPAQSANVARQVGDTRRLRVLCGEPTRPLERSLADLLDYAVEAARTA